MNTLDDDALKRALTLSARMLSASERSDWDAVRALHGELEHALRDADAPTPANRDAYATLLEQQQRVRERAQAAQRELEEVMSRQNYNQRALHTYLSPGR